MPRHGHGHAHAVAGHQQVRARHPNKGQRASHEYQEVESTTQCPLCCEDLDKTEKEHLPCPCGYQVCLFCLSRLKDEYGNRCPGCRTLYGTDREEWARQSEARALEAQAQQLQRSPKRPPKPPAASTEVQPPARQRSVHVSSNDEGDLPGRRSRENKIVPPPAQPAADLEPQHWPSLAQPQRAVEPKASAAQPAPSHRVPSRTSSSSSIPQHSTTGLPRPPRHITPTAPVPPAPTSVPIPVTIQSQVNGQTTCFDTILELRPPGPQEQRNFVPADGGLERLISQFQQLATPERPAPTRQPIAPQPAAPPRQAPQPHPLFHMAPAPVAADDFGAGDGPPGIAPGPAPRAQNGLDTAPGLGPLPMGLRPSASFAHYAAGTSNAYRTSALLDPNPRQAYSPNLQPEPNLLHSLFQPPPAPPPPASNWFTEGGTDDVWNEPFTNMFAGGHSSYAAKRVPLYERGNPAGGGEAGSHGDDATSSPAQDPVISPTQLAARAKPIGGGYPPGRGR